MPWKGPEYPGEFPSLGFEILTWLEEHLVIPDGDRRGEPFVPTREQAEFAIRLFRIDPATSRMAVRRALLMRSKGWGKSPFVAALCWAAAKGPIVFAGWDAAGEPVGRPRTSPWIQVAALAEDQTVNTWSALYEMANPDAGSPLTRAYPDIDLGISRIFCDGGGRIEFVTSEAGTREGQRVTFAVMDESGLWRRSNGGKRLAGVLFRNVAKMDGMTVETTNAYVPGEESVAEATYEAARSTGGILIDHREAPRVDSLDDRIKLKDALRYVYGDSCSFVNLDRLADECQDPGLDDSEKRRFYLNQLVVASDAWIDPADWARCERRDLVLEDDDPIALGFDGSLFDDATALHACRISDGFVVELGVWEKPDGAAGDDWEVPRVEVDAAVAAAFERYSVVRFYADPPYWQDDLARWAAEYGDKIVKEWWTNRERAMVAALERFRTAVKTGELAHDGAPTTTAHIGHTRRRKTRSGVVIRKESPSSSNKIDASMSATLAYEARADALAAGLAKPRRRYRAGGF
jgi:hypothetical protein